jgi:beta-glucosidase
MQLVLLLLAAGAGGASALSERAVQASVRELVGAMSNAQKARQLMIQDVGVFLTNGDFDAAKAKAYLGTVGAGKIDSYGRNVDPILGNQIQAAILASNPLGVGGILSEECQHGVQGDWHTIFPSPYTVAATFDRELMGMVGETIGTEARAAGTAECWSPVCGLAREPRWGRSEEEMGEDPYLAGELAAAMVRGMTGAGRATPATLTADTTVAPLLKHFAAYCQGPRGAVKRP